MRWDRNLMTAGLSSLSQKSRLRKQYVQAELYPPQVEFRAIERAWLDYGRLAVLRSRAVAGHHLGDSGRIYYYLAQILGPDVALVVAVGHLGHSLGFGFGWHGHC